MMLSILFSGHITKDGKWLPCFYLGIGGESYSHINGMDLEILLQWAEDCA